MPDFSYPRVIDRCKTTETLRYNKDEFWEESHLFQTWNDEDRDEGKSF